MHMAVVKGKQLIFKMLSDMGPAWSYPRNRKGHP